MGIGTVIWWILVGLVAGILGKLVMPGRDPGGFIITILLGIAGAFVGGFVMYTILGFGQGGFIWTVVVATIGAIILLALYRAFAGGGRRRA